MILGKIKSPSMRGVFYLCLLYSAEITDTGQTDSQEPQSMQVSLISYLVSPSEIAATGQTDAQEPHLMQPSAITLMINLHRNIIKENLLLSFKKALALTSVLIITQ